MNLGEGISSTAAGVVTALSPLVRFARPDIGKSLDERRRTAERFSDWGAGSPQSVRVWVHGASAGELLGAVPAVDELRGRRAMELVVTHFSPSAGGVLERLAPDIAGLAPLDRVTTYRDLMGALKPDVLVFAKLDVWPAMVAEARRAGVRTALVNATVRSGSSRLRWPAKTVFRSAYRRLEAVGAASGADRERLLWLGVRDRCASVTGDASFDLALSRAEAARAPGGMTDGFERRLPARPPDGQRLIAGSTWPEDERALLAALAALPPTAEGRFGWQVVLAPHEPSEANVRRLVGECRGAGHPVVRWSEGGADGLPGHGIVVFDEMGTLAELYTAADVAYVGGGLGGSGLHNVLEPAAAGVPVVFGPKHDRAEAMDLENQGGGYSGSAGELAALLTTLSDPVEREASGNAASRFVRAGCGAASRTADLIERLLDEAPV